MSLREVPEFSIMEYTAKEFIDYYKSILSNGMSLSLSANGQFGYF